MNQTVFVNRFCAIENYECKKQISFKGSRSYFFAYPGNTKAKSWSNELVKELKERGFSGVRWEDVVSEGPLFSKICDEIHANGFILAEVTELNLNVLMEIGYALAVGRHPILLRDQNIVTRRHKLLSSLEDCPYTTRPDIHDFIQRWFSKHSESISPNRWLPFLENMGIYDDQVSPQTTYHLKPKVSTDWISRIEKSLKRSHFKLTSMDPSDSVYDEFYVQARQIQRSSHIVSSFISTDHVESEVKNASVALLTGFSIGLGKQVLVLQEEPIASILDLGTVSRPFETEHQAQRIVEDWIKKQVDQSANKDRETRIRTQERENVELIRSIYMGHPDALRDIELHNYFVETKEFHDAIEGRRSIFVGRRGSGKSANFQEICSAISEMPNFVGVEILPDDFQLERITSFLRHTTYLPDSRLTFQSIWNYVLVTEILKSLVENTTLLYSSTNDTFRNNLLEIHRREREIFDMDFGSRTVSVLESVMPADDESTFEEKRLRAEIALKSIRDYDLNRQLKGLAMAEKITFFVIADDLDKHWDTNTTQSIDLLVGLLAEIGRMQKYFGKHLRVALFLREDIFNTLAKNDEDLPKRDFLRMQWTESNLRHLVAVRLAMKVGDLSDEEIWTTVFPEPINDIEASEYILTRSLPRPRDVLDFCQKAIDQAQINEHTHVTEQDVLDGEEAFSGALFFSVSSEFKVQYPELDEVLFEFAEFAEKTSWSDFEVFAQNLIQEKRGIIRRWMGARIITPYFLTEVLFNVGLIGLSREWDSPVHFYSGKSFSGVWRLTSTEPVVHIHPAFKRFLEVKPCPSQSNA